MMRKMMFLLVFLIGLAQAFAQEKAITGKVVDENGAVLPGATVLLKGTTKGAVTDINGMYSINVPATGGVLIYSYVGYVPKESEIGTNTVINIGLAPDVKSLEQVVVVGYGVQKKSLVTGSIAKVDSKEITAAPAARIDQAIQGKTSGVYMAQTSGSPGSAMSVKIRGNSSNGKNDPLYIVDGVKTPTIDFLSPNDIESIEILKDAASSAIYGSEGGNGVVIISTKKGKQGVSEINYNYYHGWQNIAHSVKMMNAKEYIDYQKRAYTMEAKDVPTSNAYKTQMANFAHWDSISSNTNWMDQIKQQAPVDEHNISFSSGNDKGNMLLSASYYNQDGTVGGSKNNYTRYTFHFSGESKIKEWMSVGSNVSYSKSKKSNLNESSEFGGIISNAMFFDPTVPVYYKDTSELPSSLKPNPNDAYATAAFNALAKNSKGQYFSLSVPNDYDPATAGEARNPVGQIYNTYNTTSVDKVLADIHADLKFTDYLKLTSKVSMDYSLNFDNIFTPKVYANDLINYTNDTSNITLENTYAKYYKYSLENYLSFNKTFGDHGIEALAGMSYENYMPTFLDVTSYGVPHNDPKFAYFYNTLNQTPGNIPRINGGIGTITNNDPGGQRAVQVGAAGQSTILDAAELQNSYFGRLVYNYKEKYMIQGNIRRDGSSLFGPDYHYGTFPSFSLGWNVSREDFFKDNITFINNMKVRFSWGQNGNKQILSPFQYTSVITTSNIYYPDASGKLSTGAVPDNPGNVTLHWETSQQSDAGVEMSLLSNKIIFSVDYFDKRTKDQLAQNALVPLYLGFNNIPYSNTGEVQNKGWEFDLSYRQLEGEFKYSVSFNASYLKNEVLSYGSKGAFKDGIRIGINDVVTRYEAGYPVWYYRGYKAIGIFQTTDDVLNYGPVDPATGKVVPIQPKAIPGDIKYADTNGDGKITGSDATNYLGKPLPDWTFGLNFNLEYKGFDLNGLFQGVTGNQLFFAVIRTDRPTFNRPEYYYTKMWTGPGTSNTYPRASENSGSKYVGQASANFNWSNLNISPGDYLRLKNLTLGYTLPNSLTSKIGINKLRVYGTGTNILTFTKYMGTDPEIGQVVASDPSTYGVDRGLYPPSKTYTVGVNVTF